jgi:hypothetical protein
LPGYRFDHLAHMLADEVIVSADGARRTSRQLCDRSVLLAASLVL